MKAILEFNLPDDQDDFKKATDGYKWALAAWDMDQYLRSQTKYAPDSMPEEVYNALQEARDKLHEIVQEYTLSFDD